MATSPVVSRASSRRYPFCIAIACLRKRSIKRSRVPLVGVVPIVRVLSSPSSGHNEDKASGETHQDARQPIASRNAQNDRFERKRRLATKPVERPREPFTDVDHWIPAEQLLRARDVWTA